MLIGHEGYLGRGLHSFLSRKHHVIGWDKKEDLFKLDARLLAREDIELLINLSVMADLQSKTFQAGAPTDEVNVGGARHLVKILKGSDIAWIQMSTREVFGTVYRSRDVRKTKAGYRPKFLVNEECRYAPQNFYGKSKLMAEFISESHPKSNIIRLTTCYTDFDHDIGNWMINIIRACAQHGSVTLTQGGLQFRDPLHIDDLGRLMERLYEKKVFQEKIHAGGGQNNLISLKEFALTANPRTKIQHMEGGDYGFAFDNNKALRLTGWEPQVRVRDKIPVIAENIRRGATHPEVL